MVNVGKYTIHGCYGYSWWKQTYVEGTGDLFIVGLVSLSYLYCRDLWQCKRGPLGKVKKTSTRWAGGALPVRNGVITPVYRLPYKWVTGVIPHISRVTRFSYEFDVPTMKCYGLFVPAHFEPRPPFDGNDSNVYHIIHGTANKGPPQADNEPVYAAIAFILQEAYLQPVSVWWS